VIDIEKADNGFQLYDTELGGLLDLLGEIDERVRGRSIDRDSLDRELRDRCATEIGIRVSIRWYTCGEEQEDGTLKEIPGMYKPFVVPQGRMTKEAEYDHDRQRHEVINDVLGIGEGGLIKVTAEDARKVLETVGGHKHGSGCGH
jgi:hypothetical protein